MVWAREQAFVAELADCLEKASTGRLERLAGIAIDDDKQVGRCAMSHTQLLGALLVLHGQMISSSCSHER